MELLRMPPVETHVSANLHPWQSTLSSRSFALASKADRLQSVLLEGVYKASALNAKALNVLSLLAVYQAALSGEFTQSRDSTA